MLLRKPREQQIKAWTKERRWVKILVDGRSIRRKSQNDTSDLTHWEETNSIMEYTTRKGFLILIFSPPQNPDLKESENCVKDQIIHLRYSPLCQTACSHSRANMVTTLAGKDKYLLHYWHLRIMSFLMTQWIWYSVMEVLNFVIFIHQNLYP